MGKRGPKPTPTAILKARGSWRANTRPNEPQPGRGIPAMPDTLDEQAVDIWQRLAPALDEMGVLTTNDGDALGRYCITLARWMRAVRVLQRHGETYRTKTTAGHPAIKMRPEVSIAKGLAVDLAKLEAQFGMTPSARASLSVTAIFTPGRKTSAKDGDEKPPKDPPPGNVIQGKDRFFGGKPA